VILSKPLVSWGRFLIDKTLEAILLQLLCMIAVFVYVCPKDNKYNYSCLNTLAKEESTVNISSSINNITSWHGLRSIKDSWLQE
jgi:hypothetical protein